VLWVVDIQIIRLLDKYHFIYVVKGTHIIFGCSSAVPRAYEHARDVPGMTLCAATTLIQHDLPDLACGWAKSHSGHIFLPSYPTETPGRSQQGQNGQVPERKQV